jgi:hypothetical protein
MGYVTMVVERPVEQPNSAVPLAGPTPLLQVSFGNRPASRLQETEASHVLGILIGTCFEIGQSGAVPR